MSETTSSTATDATTQQNPNLNLADLVNVLQVIRTCATRGAFRAEEMSSVGGLHDRIQEFLVATGAVKTSEIAGQESADAAQESTTE